MRLWFFIILLGLLHTVQLGTSQRRSGKVFPQRQSKKQSVNYSSACRIRNNGGQGVCRKLSECQSAQQALNYYRIQPTICYNDRSNPVVCCLQRSLNSRSKSSNNNRVSNNNIRQRGATTATGNNRINNNNRRRVVPSTSSRLTSNNSGSRSKISAKKCTEFYFPSTKKFEAHILVVGGENALVDEFPYMAAIGWTRSNGIIDYNCGGVYISNNFVLTAAHCTSLGGIAPDVVRIGGGNLNDKASDDSVVKITQIYVHPRYNSRQTYNDIALFRFSGLTLKAPACLWQVYDAKNVAEITAIGYGHTQFAGRHSNILQKVKLKLFSNRECSRFYSPASTLESGIIDSQICAGDLQAARDTCQGDSGGPIIVKLKVRDKTIPFVMGITSFGQGCAGRTPSIYTRIGSYLSWIESIVWP